MVSRMSRILTALRLAGRWVARAQALVLLTLVYFLALPLFSLCRLADPLKLSRRRHEESTWRPRAPVEPSVERFSRLF
jgi:hypothetical protein